MNHKFNALLSEISCVTYSHNNNNDERGAESGSGRTVSYGYDDNGNAVSRNDGADTVACDYDHENRLVSAGSVGYAYDADGVRVSSVSDGSVTNYAVDRNRQYAQVSGRPCRQEC